MSRKSLCRNGIYPSRIVRSRRRLDGMAITSAPAGRQVIIDESIPEPLTESSALDRLRATSFTAGPAGRAGIELEYLVHDRSGDGHPAPERLRALHDDLRGLDLAGAFTAEPGGQVELSSPPADGLAAAVAVVEPDLARFTEVARRHGVRLVGAGIDPFAPPPRILDAPRYAAMEAYFDGWGPSGRAMMRSTASVQLNVEAGRAGAAPDDACRRWHLLHQIGPALAATFSTSSRHATPAPAWAGHAGMRQGVWGTLDPARCAAPDVAAGETVPQAWARWVLDAPLMVVRRPEGRPWTAPPGVSFRRWIAEGAAVVPDRAAPGPADLAYHLSTLFPPVRARGHLEVRYLDQQPGRWWRVPVAVVSALLEDDALADAVTLVCAPTAGRWRESARLGLADPAFVAAGDTLLRLARDGLDRDPATTALAALVEEYRDRWTARGLTPSTDPAAGPEEPC
jgi:glutamate--cysteine ligase